MLLDTLVCPFNGAISALRRYNTIAPLRKTRKNPPDTKKQHDKFKSRDIVIHRL
jgi:hypothetical protein